MMQIPFEAINAAALAAYPALLQEWFPHGKVRGKEFVVGNLQGKPGDSLSINIREGVWRDFGNDAGGGCGGSDPISLRAAMAYRGDQGAAARELGQRLGVYMNGAGASAASPDDTHKPQQSSNSQSNGQKPDVWKPMAEPPPCLGKPPESLLAEFDVVHEYTDQRDRVTHYVGRIEAKNGRKKVFIPVTAGALNGTVGWHKRAPATPRPLYGLNRLATMPGATVILCEGEKAADAAQTMFPDHACVSWMGGANAVSKADFSPLKGRKVILWPDNDPEGKRAVAEISELLPQARTLYVEDLGEGDDAADVHSDDPETWLKDRLPPEEESEADTALWFDDDEWDEKDIPVRQWIAKGYALRGAVTVEAGPGGGGKSLLAIAHSISLALGRHYGRFEPVGPCKVMVYNVEDDREEQRRRLSATLRRFGAKPADIKGKIVRVGPNQVGTLLARVSQLAAQNRST
jgi:AAA domain/Domain of unknown function (DUF6371)/Toprim-like